VENVAPRHQVVVLRRQMRGRVRLTNVDRLILVRLCRWFPSILRALVIVQPETVIRWHPVAVVDQGREIASATAKLSANHCKRLSDTENFDSWLIFNFSRRSHGSNKCRNIHGGHF
jgi:hypothetical protein